MLRPSKLTPKELYDLMYESPDYAIRSRQHEYCLTKLRDLKPNTVVDLGAGRAWVEREYHTNYTLVDLDNYSGMAKTEFIKADFTKRRDLNKLAKRHWDIAICLDVIEHLPRGKQEYFIKTIAGLCDKAVLTIAGTKDVIEGHKLHLTVETMDYYTKMLFKYFSIYEVAGFDDVYYYTLGRRL